MIRGVGGREKELTYEDKVKDEDSLASKEGIYQIMNGICKVNMGQDGGSGNRKRKGHS